MLNSSENSVDIDALRRFTLQLSEERDALKSTAQDQRQHIERLEKENAYLNERLRILLHQRFGQSSETLKALQIDFFDTPESLTDIADQQEQRQDLKKDIEVKAHKKKSKVGRPKLPAHLERRIQIETLP